MWPINYEDLNKFHISIGIGIIVAGFILNMLIFNYYIGELNEIKDTLSNADLNKHFLEDRTYLDLRLDTTNPFYHSLISLQKCTFYIGLFFFFLGYIPFLIINWSKNYNNIKEGFNNLILKK